MPLTLVRQSIKKNEVILLKNNWKKLIISILLILGITFLFLLFFGTFVHAVGLVDDTIDTNSLYSTYSLDNYQLDFYVDTDWEWLPWNWKDGIGNQVQYGLYAMSNFLWTISLYLSNATGYLVQQAFTLDFISDTANQLGENMQLLAGISESGFSTSGFYSGLLLLFILITGSYVTYVGLIKRETSKVIQTITNFVVVFLLSTGFLAYAPSYVQKINEFSSDISQSSLNLGSKIVLPNVADNSKNSVDLIRDTLFSVQVEQPWLLLQFDNNKKEEIGESRVNALLSVNPNTNNGKDREEIVKKEIEENDNQNLTLTKTVNRLGTVVFLVLFNIGISVFVFLLTGIMIFSQLLFILYAMFLPISFLLSLLPTFTNMGKTALMKLFNTIMLRSGITLTITVAFSLSTMIYSLTTTYPFFLIAFLQIVVFAGIYLKLGDILSFFHLKSNDSQQIGRSVLRRPKQSLYRGSKRLQRTLTRNLVGGTIGYLSGKSRDPQIKRKTIIANPSSSASASRSKFGMQKHQDMSHQSQNYQNGQRIRKVLNSKNRATHYLENIKEQIKNLPIAVSTSIDQTSNDFKQGILDEHTKPYNKKNRLNVSSITSNNPNKKRYKLINRQSHNRSERPLTVEKNLVDEKFVPLVQKREPEYTRTALNNQLNSSNRIHFNSTNHKVKKRPNSKNETNKNKLSFTKNNFETSQKISSRMFSYKNKQKNSTVPLQQKKMHPHLQSKKGGKLK